MGKNNPPMSPNQQTPMKRRRSTRFSKFIGSAMKCARPTPQGKTSPTPRRKRMKETTTQKRRTRASFLVTPKSFRKKKELIRASTHQKRLSTQKENHSCPMEKKVLFQDTTNDLIVDSHPKQSSNQNQNQNVKVVARLRPLSTKEKNENSYVCFEALTNESALVQLSKTNKDSDKRRFDYDAVFGPNSSQKEVYEKSAGDVVRSNIFKGFNVTILAYGQTGSGKTFTMGTEGSTNHTLNETDGVIPRAIYDIFNISNSIDQNQDRVSVTMSYLEIYNEEIRDLLSNSTDNTELTIRDTGDGVVVPNLSFNSVHSPQDVSNFMKSAAAKRATASTAMNSVSSRSHAICTLHVVIKASEENNDEDEIRSKLTLVDLAGSERIKRTKAEGARMKEGININKGLFVLGQVVSALSELGQREGLNSSAQNHIPYRDSKLTRLLQDSLGGNSRTVMIACVSPAQSNLDESTNTLRYATRTRNIKNAAVRNVVAKTLSVVEAAALRKENQMLKLQLLQAQAKINTINTTEYLPITSRNSEVTESNDNNANLPNLDTAKLEIVTKLKANISSLHSKMEHLKERLHDATDDILQASIRGDKWQNKYDDLLSFIKQNDIDLPKEYAKDNEDLLSQLRNEVQMLKTKAQESQEDAVVARATAAVLISNNGDLSASQEMDITNEVPESECDESEHNMMNERLTTDLVAINKEIEMKEKMAMQTLKEKEAMNLLQSHFEDAIKTLEEEVNVLTSERESLVNKIQNFEKSKKDVSNSSPQLKTMRDKVAQLEERMKILKKKSAEHTKSLRMRDLAEKKCDKLTSEIAESKKRRTTLQKKLKEESNERRIERKAAQAHATKIMRDKQKLAVELNKVKQLAARQTAVLKRKAMEAISRQKSDIEKLRKKNIAASMRSAGTVDLSSERKEDIVKWLKQEIETSTIVNESMSQIEDQKKLLDQCYLEKELLESKSDNASKDPNNSIQNALRVIENEIKSRTVVIKQLESTMKSIYGKDLYRSSPFADLTKWNSFSKSELKFVHTITFEQLMEIKSTADEFRLNQKKLTNKAINDAVVKEKRRQEDTIMKIRMQHSEDIMSLLESTQGAVERNVMLRVLENTESSGGEPSIQKAVDDLLKSYMEGCNKIGSSVKRELAEVRETHDGMKKMVDQVAVDLIAAKKSGKRKKTSTVWNDEEEKFVFADDDMNEGDSDDSDWDPEEYEHRSKGPKKKRRKEREDISKVLSPKLSNEDTNVSPMANSTTEIHEKENKDLDTTDQNESQERKKKRLNDSVTLSQKKTTSLIDNVEMNDDFERNSLIVEEKNRDVNDVTEIKTQTQNMGNKNTIEIDDSLKMNKSGLEEQDKDMFDISEIKTPKHSLKTTLKVDSSMKVAELKELLRKRGLKVSGKKSELLRRLRSPKPSDKSRQSEIPKKVMVNVPEQSKENISPEFTIYTENDTERRTRPMNKRQRNPLQRRDLNELETKTKENEVVKKYRNPLLEKTRSSVVVETGAERRRNLAQTLKASLRETELLL